MKKHLFTALLVFGLFVNAPANDNFPVTKEAGISSSVQTQFARTFTDATQVSWELTKRHQKASFIQNGVSTTAFYDLEDKYVATTRILNYQSLPPKSLNLIGKRYKKFMISTVILYDDGELAYFVKMIKNNRKLLLRVMTDNTVYLFRKLN